MAGIHNEVLYGANMDFREVWPPVGQITLDGQIFIGSTAAPNLQAGFITSTGGTINWSFGSGTINGEVASPSIKWNNITASQALASGNGYFCVSPGGALSLSLPAVSAVGDTIEVALDGATSFAITQGAGQQIKMGNAATTAGVGGSLTSTQQGDTLRMVCRTANLLWVVMSSMGNLTVV